MTLVAVSITLLKWWWKKEKEKQRLEKEKIIADLQLLKAEIHPEFIFNTLGNITSHAEATSPKAPEMLIKLSDLLSYMLYESDAPKVRLENELGMIKEYMMLEKIRQGDRLDLTFQFIGNVDGHLISPLILFPFIEKSFSYCNNLLVGQAWINLEICISENILSMKIINGIGPGEEKEENNVMQPFVQIKKRLQLLYPGRHEIKINSEHELRMVHLNLKLEEVSEVEEIEKRAANTIISNAGF